MVRALTCACGDAVRDSPRWAHDSAHMHPIRHAGLINGVERFDHAAFGIIASEARAMDPQQRLLLEVGYTAFALSGTRRAALLSSDTSVSLGVMHADYAAVHTESSSVYARATPFARAPSVRDA